MKIIITLVIICATFNFVAQESAQACLKTARDKFNNKEYDDARKFFKKCMKADPAYADTANYGIGIVILKEMNLGSPSPVARAGKFFSRAIKINPKYTDAYYTGAMAYMMDSYNLDDAIEWFTKVIELSPSLAPEAYHFRGICYTNSRKRKKACEDWKTALSLGYQDSQRLLNANCK